VEEWAIFVEGWAIFCVEEWVILVEGWVIFCGTLQLIDGD